MGIGTIQPTRIARARTDAGDRWLRVRAEMKAGADIHAIAGLAQVLENSVYAGNDELANKVRAVLRAIAGGKSVSMARKAFCV